MVELVFLAGASRGKESDSVIHGFVVLHTLETSGLNVHRDILLGIVLPICEKSTMWYMSRDG